MKQPNILSLRPTQFVLGMKEIEAKVSRLKLMSDKERLKYCEGHKIPLVIGPKNEMYMIDHHHFARACWEQNVKEYEVTVIKDLSRLDEMEFWNVMIREGWTYLYDQFGMGPHSPLSLPTDVRCMADDPFRSLAWAVRDAGFIKKCDVPFFEFQWAAYFRFNLEMPLHSKSDFKTAIEKAKKLAKAKAARHLPGALGSKAKT
jgi:hypothetical protein